jgi:cytochrome P450
MRTARRSADRTEITSPTAVRQILDDPGYVVPDPGCNADLGTVAWLRQRVARFSTDEHAQRRQLVLDILSQLDPDYLRARASSVTCASIDAAGLRPFEVMSQVARRVPGTVLAEVLRAADTGKAAAAAAVVAAAYQPGSTEPGSQAELAADAAVAQLVAEFSTLLPPQADDQLPARIGVLIQAHDATAVLIGTALLAAYEAGHPTQVQAGAAGLVQRTLREDPPARWTRRVSPAGELAWLSLACAGNDPAGHLAFGHGPRYCPGAAHAEALAAGVLQPLLERCQPARPPVIAEGERPRVPQQLDLMVVA